MEKISKTGGILLCAVAAIGFILPFWPLCAIAIVLLAFLNRWLLAILVALVLDVAWGAPGFLYFIFFPFTALALVAMLLRKVYSIYVWGNRAR